MLKSSKIHEILRMVFANQRERGEKRSGPHVSPATCEGAGLLLRQYAALYSLRDPTG